MTNLLNKIVAIDCSKTQSKTCALIAQRLTQLGAKVLCASEIAADGKAKFKELISRADVVIYDHNNNLFDHFGVTPQELQTSHPRLILAEFSAFGSHTIYSDRQAHELIIQACSGITWLSGNRDDDPTPIGLDIASKFCASYLTQAILAALYKREKMGSSSVGSKVSTSLLESLLSIQLEMVTTSANNAMQTPPRAKKGNAHSGLPAPYGVYKSRDGYFAMSFVAITRLTQIMGIEIPEKWHSRESWLWYRDQIMEALRPHFLQRTNREWMELFTPHDIWCSEINDLGTALELEAYKELDLERREELPNGEKVTRLNLPYKILTHPANPQPEPYADGDKSLYSGLMAMDVSQYLSGPSSTLQMADFGATVIKIERPEGGDMGRNVVISNLLLDSTSTSFLAVGRNKRSAAYDLKNEQDRVCVRELMSQADIIVQNFRPSVMERLGLDYQTIREINPRVIYAQITGYGESGCWVRKPGQDYIVQALTGLCMLSGDEGHEPVPIGLPVVDLIAGCHLDEAVAAALYNRACRGEGAHIKVTMLGSAMDLQSEQITTYRSGGKVRKSYQSMIRKSGDEYLAEDGSIDELGRAKVDRCKVLNWRELFDSQLGSSLGMLQEVERGNGFRYVTTRCPVRFDDQIVTTTLGAPQVGEYTEQITQKYNL